VLNPFPGTVKMIGGAVQGDSAQGGAGRSGTTAGVGGAAQGGGIYVLESALTLTDAPVSGDAARGGAGGAGLSSGVGGAGSGGGLADGGAVDVTSENLSTHQYYAAVVPATVTITGAIMLGDQAEGGAGGAGIGAGAGGAGGQGAGGAISNGAGGMLTLSNAALDLDAAIGGVGGAGGGDGGAGLGGALFNAGPSVGYGTLGNTPSGQPVGEPMAGGR
jgi:hypothetical protein